MLKRILRQRTQQKVDMTLRDYEDRGAWRVRRDEKK